MRIKALYTIVFSAMLMFSVGCLHDGDDSGDDGSSPTGPGNGGTDVPELSPSEADALTESYFLASLDEAVANQQDGVYSLEQESGFYYGDRESFTGPDSEGWYTYDDDSMSGFTVKLKWTPDIWADTTLTADRIDVLLEFESSSSGYTVSTTLQTWTEYTDATREYVDGAISMDVVSSTSSTGDDFHWSLSWDDVSVATDDYSGSYSGSGSYYLPVYGGLLNNLTSQFDFNADGSGTGHGAVGGTEIIRFTFGAVGSSGEQTVTYTLRSENWETDHTYMLYY